ncbi:MAG TPA: hypothetical protein VLU46_03355 [Thermoanaerobaculia bacterium]|nr:hypothetical protein [Thermoanaerobaculia bacterium]
MFLPRLLSILLLLISVAMLIPLGLAAYRIATGIPVPPMQWFVPLAIMATASVMMWLLTRKAVSLQLYLMAFSLWLVTAGYFFYVTQF